MGPKYRVDGHERKILESFPAEALLIMILYGLLFIVNVLAWFIPSLHDLQRPFISPHGDRTCWCRFHQPNA